MENVIEIRWYSDGKGIDAEDECDACEVRAPNAWSYLITHLERAMISRSFVEPFATTADANLYIYPERGSTEAVAYHYRGKPPVLEVLAFGQIRGGYERGPFVSEAQRRKTESLK